MKTSNNPHKVRE